MERSEEYTEPLRRLEEAEIEEVDMRTPEVTTCDICNFWITILAPMAGEIIITRISNILCWIGEIICFPLCCPLRTTINFYNTGQLEIFSRNSQLYLVCTGASELQNIRFLFSEDNAHSTVESELINSIDLNLLGEQLNQQIEQLNQQIEQLNQQIRGQQPEETFRMEAQV